MINFCLLSSLFIFSQAPDESALHKLSAKLTENGVDHKLWIEQPENYPTCLAVKPYSKGNNRKSLLVVIFFLPPIKRILYSPTFCVCLLPFQIRSRRCSRNLNSTKVRLWPYLRNRTQRRRRRRHRKNEDLALMIVISRRGKKGLRNINK